ncbi:M48 family metalloprotease [Fulvivirgaceae bacterium BMA12]|uniref:M48 family metalloprotease n=1 Tax=Agaribacillus aureus TaxID=3051825 RepID=A0ABT8L7A1_9BACT|nr:M48 family metalloprotease [Fulvivirgaceae bacterium BMA12]
MIKDIKLSTEFKAQTTRAVVSIAFFALTYLLIFIMAIALTALCVFGGIMIIKTIPRFITIVLGIGLASLGFLILIFLLKFIFKSHKTDRSHLYEITKANEPELFELIHEIVSEVGTSFPKKVYLSMDVNAAVFYDSNFWSMVLPVKKNLQIGLGLVNTVTKEELKAILAHEFGHFSQKTMKVGSYVYNVNQVIFNMLYDNEGYDKLVQSWANISNHIAIFVVGAVKIIEGLQWVLKKMYEVVNKSYMGLSREMEFHADEIAANVTGYEPLKNSLLRMQLADYAFNAVLTFYEGKITDNLKSENIYKEQTFILNFLANDSNIPISNGFPEVTLEELNKFNKSKLVIKDQWASHPGTEERIEMLEKTNIKSKQAAYAAANTIFKNIEKTQEELTVSVFKEVQYEKEAASMPFEDFQIAYEKEFLNNTFAKIYNGYYDDKNPLHFEPHKTDANARNVAFEELYSNQKVNLVYTQIALLNDIETLKHIADKTIPVKTFDYDGKKYKRKASRELISKLNLELDQLNEQIQKNDIEIFNFFKTREQLLPETSRLESLYKQFFDFDKEFDGKYQIYTKMSNDLQFVNFTTPFDQIRANFRNLESLESELKKEIKALLADTQNKTEITKDIADNFKLYLSKPLRYFGNEIYFDENLGVLFTALANYAFLLSRAYFLRKKELLDYQEGLIAKPLTTKEV